MYWITDDTCWIQHVLDHSWHKLAVEQTFCTLATYDSKWVTSFLQCTLNSHPNGVVARLFASYMAGATWNCAISAHSVYTIQSCTISHHFMQSHMKWLLNNCYGTHISFSFFHTPPKDMSVKWSTAWWIVISKWRYSLCFWFIWSI